MRWVTLSSIKRNPQQQIIAANSVIINNYHRNEALKALYLCVEFHFTGCLIAGFLLMTEMATPKWRRWANCLSQVAYGVGIAVQALIAFFIRDWKPFSLVITLLNLPFIAYYW